MAQTRKTKKKTSRSAKKATSAGKKTRSADRKPASSKKASSRKASTRKSGAGAASSESEHPTVTMVRGLAEVIEAHSLSELIVDSPDLTLTLRRAVSGAELVSINAGAPVASAGGPAMVAAPPVTAVLPVAAPAVETAAAPSASAAEPAPEDNYHVVTSPFVGTFYRRPNPDASPYVEIGARVEKGEVLCIVEAMKLMNEIEADASGNVVAVLVDDGEPVEYGQSLFKIDSN